jgi:hypothetical protein
MRPLVPALGAAVLVAAAIVWAPLPGGQDADPTAGDPAAGGPADPPARITASPAAAYIQFAPANAIAGAAAAPKPGPPVLVGLGGAGRMRTAYIMANGATVRAQVGDKVGAWRLAAIGPHSVTLRSGGKSMSLAFYGPRAEPPPPAQPDEAAAAPAAAPAAPPPVSHAPEPASAPPPRATGGRRYWVGPPGSAPPGYIVLKPGQAPPL